MGTPPVSKRRRRKIARIQARNEQKPRPTFLTYRENSAHFAARMKDIRERVAVSLLRNANEKQRAIITTKLTLPWKWYSKPEQFFNEQSKTDLFFGFWKKYVELSRTTQHDPRKRMELKKIRGILRAFTNPQVGYFGEMSQGGKKVVIAIIGRDMTPAMIVRRMKEYLTFDPKEGWALLGGEKSSH